MEPTCETELLHMNDDGLLEIFKHMRIEDLASISHVCQRLHYLAEKSFHTHHKKSILVDVDEDLTDGINSFEYIVKAFGETAIKVMVVSEADSFKEEGTDFFLQVAMHCNTMVYLAMDGLNIDLTDLETETVLEIQNYMSTVKELSLHRCNLTGFESIFQSCQALETLSLRFILLSDKNGLYQHFPSMRNLSLIDVHDYIEKGLLSKNSDNIQKLKFHATIATFTDTISALQLPQLTDLFLSLHVYNVSEAFLNNVIAEVVKCSALKVLKLNLDGVTVTNNFFRNMSSIQAIQKICIINGWSKQLMEFDLIKLRRSHIIHEKYHSFAPY